MLTESVDAEARLAAVTSALTYIYDSPCMSTHLDAGGRLIVRRCGGPRFSARDPVAMPYTTSASFARRCTTALAPPPRPFQHTPAKRKHKTQGILTKGPDDGVARLGNCNGHYHVVINSMRRTYMNPDSPHHRSKSSHSHPS
jgi:hypothetical protein